MKTKISNLISTIVFILLIVSVVIGTRFDILNQTYKGYLIFSSLFVVYWFIVIYFFLIERYAKELKKHFIAIGTISTLIALGVFFAYNLFFEQKANSEIVVILICDACFMITLVFFGLKMVRKIEILNESIKNQK